MLASSFGGNIGKFVLVEGANSYLEAPGGSTKIKTTLEESICRYLVGCEHFPRIGNIQINQRHQREDVTKSRHAR